MVTKRNAHVIYPSFIPSDPLLWVSKANKKLKKLLSFHSQLQEDLLFHFLRPAFTIINELIYNEVGIG